MSNYITNSKMNARFILNS